MRYKVAIVSTPEKPTWWSLSTTDLIGGNAHNQWKYGYVDIYVYVSLCMMYVCTYDADEATRQNIPLGSFSHGFSCQVLSLNGSSRNVPTYGRSLFLALGHNANFD